MYGKKNTAKKGNMFHCREDDRLEVSLNETNLF